MLDRKRLEEIVRNAGKMALEFWPGAGGSPEHWTKESGGLVSEADIAIDKYLKAELRALLPSAGWLSEETVDDESRLYKRLVWMVDPIDGTRDFLDGKTGWAVSVALVSVGKPLIAMLYAPAREEFYSSFAGTGSFCNGERLSASVRAEFEGARVPAEQLGEEDQMFSMVEKPNSIALRAAMVAQNKADLLATIRWGYEWDLAAVTLLAQEAGADVSDAFGAPLTFNKLDPRVFGLLVSAPSLYEAAVAHIAARAAEVSGRKKRS